MKYLVEYQLDHSEEIQIEELSERHRAIARAARLSKKHSDIVYLLNTERTGVIAFYNGRIDHRDGERI